MHSAIRTSVRSRVASNNAARRQQQLLSDEVFYSDVSSSSSPSPSRNRPHPHPTAEAASAAADTPPSAGSVHSARSALSPRRSAAEEEEEETASPKRLLVVKPALRRRSELDSVLDAMFRNEESSSCNSRLYKILVLGEVHSGKSAVIRRYVHNFFSDHYHSTIGVDFHVKILPYNDELEIRLQLWDIAGQERFTQMTRAYFKGAMGALIIFDQHNVQSFAAAEKWKKEIDSKCFLPDGKCIPTVLLANKSDLPRDRRMPDELKISQFAQDYGFVPKWFKTSALTGEGIEEAMRILVRYIMAMDTWNSPVPNADNDHGGRFENVLRLKEEQERDKRDKDKKNKKCAC